MNIEIMSKTCQNCLNKFEETDLRTLNSCKHVYCCECLVNYLKDIRKPNVKCIDKNCEKLFSDRLIRECLSNCQIDLYDRICISKCSNKLIKCLTEECPVYVICDNEGIVFECSYCKSPNCTKCHKRHYTNDCGKNNEDENAIEARALGNIKERRREELDELLKKYCLLPNPESFDCPVCCKFILPRAGVILRNCLHCFCKKCLEASLMEIKYIKQMVCLNNDCGISLDSNEIFVIFNEKRLAEMTISESGSQFFQCKNGDCFGMWDIASKIDSYECPECGKTNCIVCQDIHEGMKCEEFRRSKRYISVQDQEKILIKEESVLCFLCKERLIRKGGCYAMHCSKCGNHTCLFTGKIAGRHNPQKCYCQGGECNKIKNYCGCTSVEPCDKNCLNGCYPEDPDNANDHLTHHYGFIDDW